MYTPVLEVNLGKIKYNARKIKNFCEKSNIEICAITKGFCAELPIVEAFIEGGLSFLGDSRIQNIIKVKKKFPHVKYMMIRIPKISEAEEVITYADISLQSQLEVIEVYSQKAISMGKVHNIILMIDVGDLEKVLCLKMQRNGGQDTINERCQPDRVGTNVGCYGSIMPTVENATILINLRNRLEKSMT